MSYIKKQSSKDSESTQKSTNKSMATPFADQRASTTAQLNQQHKMHTVNSASGIQQLIAEEEPAQGKFENDAPAQLQESAAAKPNDTGLPDNLKSGIENLSGYSMDDVKVHYNSDRPAQLNAHAYAQGSDIHVAPGQERHLAHEAWHVVQQKQGRVQPTMQMKAGVPVNDDAGLENEADVMGAKAWAQANSVNDTVAIQRCANSSTAVIQKKGWVWDGTNWVAEEGVTGEPPQIPGNQIGDRYEEISPQITTALNSSNQNSLHEHQNDSSDNDLDDRMVPSSSVPYGKRKKEKEPEKRVDTKILDLNPISGDSVEQVGGIDLATHDKSSSTEEDSKSVEKDKNRLSQTVSDLRSEIDLFSNNVISRDPSGENGSHARKRIKESSSYEQRGDIVIDMGPPQPKVKTKTPEKFAQYKSVCERFITGVGGITVSSLSTKFDPTGYGWSLFGGLIVLFLASIAPELIRQSILLYQRPDKWGKRLTHMGANLIPSLMAFVIAIAGTTHGSRMNADLTITLCAIIGGLISIVYFIYGMWKAWNK